MGSANAARRGKGKPNGEIITEQFLRSSDFRQPPETRATPPDGLFSGARREKTTSR
jgi:hypothetical protein